MSAKLTAARKRFTAATKKAKTLYRSGKFKKFSDAVKAAFKKLPKKIGTARDSSTGAGHTSTSTRANTTGNKTGTKTITAHVKIGARNKYRQTGTSNRKNDSECSARPPGPRVPRGGKHVTYYERRKNRSDVPGKLTGAAHNETVLRHLTDNTRKKQLILDKIERLKARYRELPKGNEKLVMKRYIKDEQKYLKVVNHEIRMLRILIK